MKSRTSQDQKIDDAVLALDLKIDTLLAQMTRLNTTLENVLILATDTRLELAQQVTDAQPSAPATPGPESQGGTKNELALDS